MGASKTVGLPQLNTDWNAGGAGAGGAAGLSPETGALAAGVVAGGAALPAGAAGAVAWVSAWTMGAAACASACMMDASTLGKTGAGLSTPATYRSMLPWSPVLVRTVPLPLP